MPQTPPRIGSSGRPMAEPGETPPKIQGSDNKKKKKKHRIQNFEWNLLIALALIVDIIQLILTCFAVGIVINRFITIVGGMVVPVYFYLRGVNMDTKKWTNIIGSFVLELIPILDILPAWTRLIVRIRVLDKAEQKMEQMPGGQLVEAYAKRKMGAQNTGGGGELPPRISSSGRPMAEPGERPPRIDQSGRPIPESDEATAGRGEGDQSFDQNVSSSQTQPENVIDLRDKFKEMRENNVVDLRHNPQHERTQGREKGYKEAA